jgi:hypothetical protein
MQGGLTGLITGAHRFARVGASGVRAADCAADGSTSQQRTVFFGGAESGKLLKHGSDIFLSLATPMTVLCPGEAGADSLYQ